MFYTHEHGSQLRQMIHLKFKLKTNKLQVKLKN